jgi:hypothetical protein
MKVTKQNIEACVHSLKELLEREGYTQDLVLHAGEPRNGRAWRLFFEDGSEVPGLFMGYVGWTKPEAWQTLITMMRLMSDLRMHEREMMAARDH